MKDIPHVALTTIYVISIVNIVKAISINSMTPGRFERNLRKVIFKLILMIGGWGIFCKIALRWLSVEPTDDKSILVQVMAWCHQAASHYLSQYWPRSVSPYGVTRPQSVNSMTPWKWPADQNDIFSNTYFVTNIKKILLEKTLRCVARNVLMISQHCFRWWLGAVKHQVITWTNVDQDLKSHMATPV